MKIYIDQNHLSNLFHAYIGDVKGENYRTIWDKIQKSIVDKKSIYPISCLHITETAAFKFKRKELAKLLFQLSQGYSILPFFSIFPTEVENAICKKLNDVNLIKTTQQVIQQKGILFAFGNEIGVPPQYEYTKELILEQTLNEKFYVDSVSQLSEEQISEMKKEDDGLVLFFENERKKIQGMELKQAYELVGFDIFNFLLPYLKNACLNLNKDFDLIFGSMDISEKCSFVNEIDSMHIFSEFLLKRDLSNKKIHKNDSYDMGFLSTAISNCDIVITESYWKDLYKQSKLNKKYKTILLSDLNELENYI